VHALPRTRAASRAREQPARANSQPHRGSARRRGALALALAQGRDQRRDHLVQVADDGVVGLGHDWGAGSVLIATIVFAPWQPAMCWIAPLIPQAR
jgi:hypothetical protein